MVRYQTILLWSRRWTRLRQVRNDGVPPLASQLSRRIIRGAAMAEAVGVKKNWWEATAAYFTPRMLIILAMGFASGLPLLLTLSTLSYWLSKLGVDKTTIGLFALVGTPYTFKFLWSPIM